jgi:hypothetical protein
MKLSPLRVLGGGALMALSASLVFVHAQAAPVGLVPTYPSVVVPPTLSSILPPACGAIGGELLHITSSTSGLFTGCVLRVQGATDTPITPVYASGGFAATAPCPAYVPLDGGIQIEGTATPVPTSIVCPAGTSNWPTSFGSGAGLTYFDSTLPAIMEVFGGYWIIDPISGNILEWVNVAPITENSPATVAAATQQCRGAINWHHGLAGVQCNQFLTSTTITSNKQILYWEWLTSLPSGTSVSVYTVNQLTSFATAASDTFGAYWDFSSTGAQSLLGEGTGLDAAIPFAMQTSVNGFSSSVTSDLDAHSLEFVSGGDGGINQSSITVDGVVTNGTISATPAFNANASIGSAAGSTVDGGTVPTPFRPIPAIFAFMIVKKGADSPAAGARTSAALNAQYMGAPYP